MNYGRLILIPCMLSDGDAGYLLSGEVLQAVRQTRYFIVEELRSARRFLKKLDKTICIEQLEFTVLNEHTRESETADYLQPALEGHDIALMSEAGMPAIADPGAHVVNMAHHMGIQVKPLSGPSSVFLALSASGLNGQRFSFLGYLPVKTHERIAALQRIEKTSENTGQAFIFIEAPYRNNQLMESILQCLKSKSRLCVASNISDDSEFIRTFSIEKWKKMVPDLHKKPTVFIVQA